MTPGFLARSYSYDKLNRLTGVTDSGYTRSFGYDAFGNMWVTGNTGITLAGNTPTANVYNGSNQIAGTSYDAAGNQLTVNGDTVSYDAENRQTQVTEPPSLGGGVVQYFYDGAGQRVEKAIVGGAATIYVYDVFGQLAAEYATTVNTAPCAPCYLVWDHLGTPRLVTDAGGNILARHDYLPFGEEIPANTAGRNGQWGPGNDNFSQKFTGQYRDSETGEDFFNARYFTGALGRFNSPDPANAGSDPSDPQTWNGYAYVRNNPLNGIDPSGMDEWGGCDDWDLFCGWWPPFPPIGIIFGGGGSSSGKGGGSNSAGSGSSLPPNSFPGGETLGLPPGMSVPLPSPAVMLGLGLNLNCEFGVCVGSPFSDDPSGTFGNFYGFFADWALGRLPHIIFYGNGSRATSEMKRSPYFQAVRSAYIKAGCPGTPASPYPLTQGHFAAYGESLTALGSGSPNYTQSQVGGYSGSIMTVSGVTTYTIINDASFSSFIGQSTWGPFLHINPRGSDNPFGPSGPMHTARQTFQWSEAGACGG